MIQMILRNEVLHAFAPFKMLGVNDEAAEKRLILVQIKDK
jgi:hypothetical protein